MNTTSINASKSRPTSLRPDRHATGGHCDNVGGGDDVWRGVKTQTESINQSIKIFSEITTLQSNR